MSWPIQVVWKKYLRPLHGNQKSKENWIPDSLGNGSASNTMNRWILTATISILVKKEALFTAVIQVRAKRSMMKSVQQAWPSSKWGILNGLILTITTNLQTFKRWQKRQNPFG